MRKVGFVTAVVLAMLTVATVAYIWITALVGSIYRYTSPLKGAPPLTEDSSRPLTSQVVLVLVDGLRFDASLQMPYLESLRKQGAHAMMVSRPATGSITSWTALLGGARPEIDGAPLFDPSYDGIQTITIDNLFATVNRAGLTNGIAASPSWERLIPPDLLYTQYYAPGEDEAADRSIMDRCLVFLNEFRPNFLVVYLSQVNAAGLRYGTASSEHQQAIQHCDDYLRQLSANMNLTRSTLIIASSHGQLDQGGYGGDEPVLLEVPFVMVGEDVLPGDYRTMDQADLAPTIATLLGTPTPSAAQGNARLDMLRVDRIEKAERLVALASQRVRIGNIYLNSIGRGAVSETAKGDMQVARSSLQVKNYESAAELASLAVRQTGLEMSQARSSRIWDERRPRGIFLAIAGLLLLWILWKWRGEETVWSLLAAFLAAGTYHLLFLRQGSAYSFSRLPPGGLASTLNPSLRHAALSLALGGLIILWRAWRERQESIVVVIRRTYAFGLLQVYLVALVVGACAFWNGPRFAWYLPNLKVAYLHFSALMQLMATSILVIPLPAIVVVAQRITLAVSKRSFHA